MARQSDLRKRIKGLERRLEQAKRHLRLASVWLQCHMDDDLRVRAAENIKKFLHESIDTDAK